MRAALKWLHARADNVTAALLAAMFIAFIFTMIGIAISSLSRGLYDANLYQWVKDMVAMSQSETKNEIAVPGMINQVLSQ